jgi:hypothetical protein
MKTNITLPGIALGFVLGIAFLILTDLTIKFILS